VDSCLAIKCLLEPVPINAIDPPCTHPFVPETIYRDYDGKSCWAAPPSSSLKEGYGASQSQQQQQQHPSSFKNIDYSAHDDSHHSIAATTEACSFVAQAIYSHLPPIVDIVLLNNGMCNELINIEMGVFGPEDARDLLPYNNELIVLVLEGKEIVHALEHGMRDALEQGVAGAYPKTAGIRYDLAEENMVLMMMMMEEEEVSHPPEKNHPRPLKGTSSKRRRLLSSYQVWGPSCTWEALEYHKLYTVLTNEYLAQGGDGYHMLHHKAKNITSTGMREAEVFWQFAQSTCILELPQWKQKEHDNVVETQVADHMAIMADPVGTISGTTSSIRIQSH
jgi:5'-nucleotidase, C-terminal domain